jgi:hypothetical protein
VRVVVLGADGAAVARAVLECRAAGDRAAGFVGDPGEPEVQAAALAMGTEMLGGVDQVVAAEA